MGLRCGFNSESELFLNALQQPSHSVSVVQHLSTFVITHLRALKRETFMCQVTSDFCLPLIAFRYRLVSTWYYKNKLRRPPKLRNSPVVLITKWLVSTFDESEDWPSGYRALKEHYTDS